MLEIVHPCRPETWKNGSAPYLDPALARELTDIGGLNMYGEPNLRFVWGQTRTQFRRGKERLLYIDERIDAIRHTRHVLKRALLLDADGKARYEHRILREAPRVIPEGWLYEQELDHIEWIGRQLWYVERWLAPEIRVRHDEVWRPFGTPAEWEAIRYEDWEDPEIGMVRNCDVLGPFPSRGRYTSVFAVGYPFAYLEPEEEYIYETYRDPKGNEAQRAVGVKVTNQLIQDICYRPPGRDTIEAVRAAWHDLQHRHVENFEQRDKDKFYEEELKTREAREKRLKAAREHMKDEQWRWSSPDSGTTGGVGGGARAYISNTDALVTETK